MMLAFKELYPELWTEETDEAWNKLYRYIADMMTSGLNGPWTKTFFFANAQTDALKRMNSFYFPFTSQKSPPQVLSSVCSPVVVSAPHYTTQLVFITADLSAILGQEGTAFPKFQSINTVKCDFL